MYQNGNLTNQMDYTSGAVYAASGGADPQLQYFATSAGRAVKNATGYSYQYFLTDHLGNVRVVFGDADNNGVAEVVQDNLEYRISNNELRISNFSAFSWPQLSHFYTFSGRDWWRVPDPAAQTSSPYVGMGNNPVRFIDPNGNTCLGHRSLRDKNYILIIRAHISK